MQKFPVRTSIVSAALLAILVAGVPAALAAPAAGDAEAAAVAKAKDSARSWLALVDGGKYAKSWDDASSMFRSAITSANWEKAVASARTPFGSLKKRTEKSAKFARTLPGAPDGEYVVLEFDTSFEKKAEAVETVTAAKEKDGSWRIAGYFIR